MCALLRGADVHETLDGTPCTSAADNMYVAFDEKIDEKPHETGHTPWIVGLLVIALGFGAHASTQALAPAESALASLGVTPLGYAAITVSPIALGLVSPLLWGRLYDLDNALAFVLAPCGEMLGALLVAAGLLVWHANEEGFRLLANALLVLGFLCISACTAGVAIAQFSTMGRLSGRYGAFGFAALVLVKQAIGMLMAWGVPRVLATAKGDDMLGIFRVQLVLLVLHVIAVGAGVGLAYSDCVPSASAAEEMPSRAKAAPCTPPAAQASPLLKSALSLMGWSNGVSDGLPAVVLIGLWRALAVGSLHAYHSIRIRFLQSRGLPLTQAGALFAEYDGFGIVLLPLIALLCRVTGLKPMLLIAPVLTIAAFAVLLYNGGYGTLVREALFTLSVMTVAVPIVPLALLPSNARKPKLGAAYGTVEVMFITIQMAIVFLLGIARTQSGYPAAFMVMIVSFGAVTIVALAIIVHGKDCRPTA